MWRARCCPLRSLGTVGPEQLYVVCHAACMVTRRHVAHCMVSNETGTIDVTAETNTSSTAQAAVPQLRHGLDFLMIQHRKGVVTASLLP